MKKINKKGQALVEYVLIIALITTLAVVLVKILGGYLQDAITKASCPLAGEVYVKGEKRGEGKCVDPELEKATEELTK